MSAVAREIKAIGTMYEYMADFDWKTQRRMLTWLRERLHADELQRVRNLVAGPTRPVEPRCTVWGSSIGPQCSLTEDHEGPHSWEPTRPVEPEPKE